MSHRKDKFSKREDIIAKYKVTCKCGTKTIMVKADRTECRGCHHWVYRTPEIEFKYKTLESMRRNEK